MQTRYIFPFLLKNLQLDPRLKRACYIIYSDISSLNLLPMAISSLLLPMAVIFFFPPPDYRPLARELFLEVSAENLQGMMVDQ